MSCATCDTLLAEDGYKPPCHGPVPSEPRPGVNTCWLTPLPPEVLRAAGMRHELLRLKPLIGPEMALKHIGASEDDIDYMGLIEEALETVGKEAAGVK